MTGGNVAALQMNSGADVDTNLQTATALIQQAVGRGCKLIVLPENFACMGASMDMRRCHAEPDGAGPVQDYLAATAAQFEIWIVGGTLPLCSDDPDRPFASCLVYDERGERVGRYDKIHLFDVDIPGRAENYRESDNTSPGGSPVILDSPWGSLGIAVCYDLRFPEMLRFRSSPAFNVLAVPAAFTWSTGQAHWETLLKARAIENLCYVVAAAQAGMHPGARRTFGHSMIVGPWGEVVAGVDSLASAEAECVVSAEIDLAELQTLRQSFPALSHRRSDVDGSSH
jgi:predicted amidohydrolase